MSLWLRDQNRIVLCRERVMLAVTRRELTLRGIRRHAPADQMWPADAAAGEAPWHGALKALESALPALAQRRPHVTVVVSNHFMHYALIPWSDALSNEKEEMAFARHSFREMYGSEADSWELRINPGKAGMAQLACGVDARLIEDVRGVFERAGIRLHSIQPHLMAAYNSCREAFRGRSAWLVIAERGNLCLSLLQDGHWSWVRTIRKGVGWREELPSVLEREEFMANPGAATNEVLLWAPDRSVGGLPSNSRWQFRDLQPPFACYPAAEPGGQLAASMSG